MEWKCPVCGKVIEFNPLTDADIPIAVVLTAKPTSFEKFLWKIINHLAVHIKEMKEGRR